MSDEEKIPVLKHFEQEVEDNIVVKKLIEDERPVDSNPAKKLRGEKCLFCLIANVCSKPSDLDSTEKAKAEIGRYIDEGG